MNRTILLDITEVKVALDHLLSARKDPVFVVGLNGKIVAESSAGTYFRKNTPICQKIFSEFSACPPKRATYFSRPELGCGFLITGCSNGEEAGILVTVTDLRKTPHKPLSLRQSELVALARLGLRNAEIARRMNLAPSTVKTMLERLYRIAGVKNRQALVTWASGQVRDWGG